MADKCAIRLADAMPGASKAEHDAMVKEAESILRDTEGLAEADILAKLDQNIFDQAVAKKIKAANAAKNAMIKSDITNFVGGFEDKALGFEALLVGINDVKMGSRRSVYGMQQQLQGKYMAGMLADLEDLGKPALNVYRSGELDKDIMSVLWTLDKNEPIPPVSADAVGIAKVINKWQEKSRIDANEAGAYIKKMPGYIARQSHDMDKIRTAGFPEWRRAIEPELDARTFEGVEDRTKFLQSAHKSLSQGGHYGNGSIPGLEGVRNIAKSVSQERVLHFASSDGWFRYNKRFGRGELSDTVLNGLRMSAQTTGLMKVLGPNAEANYNEVLSASIKALGDTDSKASIKLQEAEKTFLNNFMIQVNGESNIPASNIGATIGQSVRAFNSVSMLGGAAISSVTDIPLGGLEMRYQGQNMLQSYGGALKNAAGAVGDIGQSIANRQLTVMTPEKRRVLAELGVSLDSTTGMFTSRFDVSGEAMPGKIAEAQRVFFRMNGLTLWTDSMRAGTMIGMGQHVGSLSKLPHSKLPDGFQDTLELFAIGSKEWDLIRSVGAKKFDGVDGDFLTPEMLTDISPALLKKHLVSIGKKPTDFQVKKLTTDLTDSFRTYYVDRSKFAVTEPDAKTRGQMLRNHAPGTAAGEVFRSVAQFKSFPWAIIQKVWGREVRGRRTKTSSMLAMSELMVGSMLFGYIAMSAKDMVKNRTPRDPTDPKTMVAAFLQGGGAGIYGDFLFGEVKTRFGGGLISTLSGPSGGTVDQVANLWGRFRDGDDVGPELFRFLYQSAPAVASVAYPAASALNTFYVKAALDNLIYYNIMEALSPGYKRRMERRLKRENDQEPLIR